MAYLNSQRRMREECWLCATFIIYILGLTGRSYSMPSLLGFNHLDPVVSGLDREQECWDGKRELPYLADLANALAAGAVGWTLSLGVPARRVRVGEAVQWL